MKVLVNQKLREDDFISLLADVSMLRYGGEGVR